MNFIREPFRRFIQLESSSSIVLFAATLAALLLANSFLGEAYQEFWLRPLTIGFPDFHISKALLLWINDGLMAIFFFVIGLEIKREIFVGELSDPRKASLPVVAAVGGMVVPVLLFFLLNRNQAGGEGWGIPMATDIAFTLGILKLLGERVPLGLKVFLTAYAIIDDLGAVLVIALFYSGEIYWSLIIWGLAIIAFLGLLGWRGVYSKYLFLPLALAVWVLFLKSGIHPTIAGILLGFTIPLGRRMTLTGYREEVEPALATLSSPLPEDPKRLLSQDQLGAIDTIETATYRIQSPLQRLENNLHGWVAYLIIPIFALSNAGVAFGGGGEAAGGLAIAIALSMVVGKALGISLFSWLAVRLGWSSLPELVSFRQILGISFLGGLGFTMALFIANLAYAESALINVSKIGILIGSTVAGLVGYFLLRRSLPTAVPQESEV